MTNTRTSPSPHDLVRASHASLRQGASDRLDSLLPWLNTFLGGGFKWGSLVEWGGLYGHNSRALILPFLSQATSQKHFVLWVQRPGGVRVYPPAWQARGVHLRYLRVTTSEQPLQELKPIFLDPLFKVIVLDNPSRIAAGDCAFLASQARRYGKVIFLLRNYALSPKRGNIWASMRLNVWQDILTKKMNMRVVRGLSPRHMSIHLGDIL